MQSSIQSVVPDGSPSPCGHYLERRRSLGRKTLIAGPRPLTYAELVDRTRKTAGLLSYLSIEPGARVVVLSERDPAITTLFFGLIAHGVTAVLLNPGAPSEELDRLLEAADAAAIFADREIVDAGRLGEVDGERLPIVPIDDHEPKPVLSRLLRRDARPGDGYPQVVDRLDEPDWALPEVPEETIAYILFTSGTTSRPKGVQISHRSLFAQMRTFVRHYGLDEESRVLNTLPLHHTDGLTHGVIMSMVAGATVHRPMTYSLERLPELMDLHYKERISHFVTVPSLLSLIRQLGPEFHDAFHYPEFRFVVSTAAYLDENHWAGFERAFGVRIVNVYGLTETVCEACYCGPDDDSHEIGTVGKPVDCEATVMDDEGKHLAPGTVGELALRGDNIMSGYFRMPEETAAVMRGDWFMTGDLATVDERGFVRIVGRKKSVIVTGGHNVYPEDVANALRSINGVTDAVVFGVEDEIWGERTVACVVPDESERDLTVERISAAFLERASREKLPRDIHIVDALPRGPSGKVVIAEAKKLATELRGRNTGPGDADARTLVYEIAAKTFKVDRESLTPASSPENVPSWDSLSHVEFLLAIESACAIKLEVRDIMNIDSLQAAVDIAEQKNAA